jgi:hypothetical protein
VRCRSTTRSGPGREAGDVSDLDEQTSSTGRADPVQVSERGAGRLEQLVEFFVGGLLAGVDPLEIADQLRSDTTAGLARDIARADRSQQRFRLRC